jgi:hypothetical protein
MYASLQDFRFGSHAIKKKTPELKSINNHIIKVIYEQIDGRRVVKSRATNSYCCCEQMLG